MLFRRRVCVFFVLVLLNCFKTTPRLLTTFLLLLLSSCYRPSHSSYQEFYTYTKPPSQETLPYPPPYLVLLVDAKHLDYTDTQLLFRSLAKHPASLQKGGSFGHAWILLCDEEGNLYEGGHSGEQGTIAQKYLEGVVDRINSKHPNPISYLWEDPRRCRSFPLSPKGELLYQGMAGDFNLIDFQLEDNVYHEVEAPTEMFESVARDLSECGVQVFEFDVMKALNRKGGDLITPGIDDHDARRKGQKKKRGRKNKYYKQIDQEDDEEAN